MRTLHPLVHRAWAPIPRQPRRGVFHLGFESDVDIAVGQGTELGLDVLMRGQRPDGSGFAYFDTVDQAGVVLMARKTQV
ncbi:MAG: hypothetical protein M3N95_08880 [Actinomycetota bacterium]|nr:hypothetical protein [Actinomycetota bacterium]